MRQEIAIAVAVIAIASSALASVENARTEIAHNPSAQVSNFRMKVIDSGKTFLKTEPAIIQFQCTVKNTSSNRIAYKVHVQVCDKDGFVLDTGEYPFLQQGKELEPGQSTDIHQNMVILEPQILKKIQKCKVRVEVKDAKESLEKALTGFILASSELRAKFEKLEKGMSQNDVKAILGKPNSLSTFPPAGEIWSYGQGSVSFDESGKVDGWTF